MKRWVTLYLIIFFCFISSLLPKPAEAAVHTSRLAGNDRYLTAIAVSQNGWPKGAETVVLTTGENYPDALSAAPLAAKNNAPILLTPSEGLGPDIAHEIKRLKAKKVQIVGGTGVIPSGVESQLSQMGLSVVRLSGADRYGTALAVAKAVGTSQGVFITPGEQFTDALAVAALAAAKKMPIVPVPMSGLPENIKSYLSGLRTAKVFVVGGEKEIPQAIRDQIPTAVNIEGADPYERNTALLKYFADSITPATVFVATGEDYPDALAAAALAQKEKNPILLTRGHEIPDSVQDYLAANVVGNITVFGGEGAISPVTEFQLAVMPMYISETRDIEVEVLEKQSYVPPKTVTAKRNDGVWIEAPVKWDLTNVSTEKAGIYHLTGSVSGFQGLAKLNLNVEPLPDTPDTLTVEVIQGDAYSLPAKLKVMMSDGSTLEYPVKWTNTPTVSQLRKVGTYTFQGTIDETKLKPSLTLKVSEDRALTFRDSNLEWAIKVMLEKQASVQPIYLSEALKMTELQADALGIRDISGLEVFTNLTKISLKNNFLRGASLSPLQKLTNLTSLNLSFNRIDQISAVKGLTGLTYLNICANEIRDFLPIKGLTRLKSLYITSNLSQDYSMTRTLYDQLTERDFSL